MPRRRMSLADQAIADARRIQQGHMTQGEIMNSHMTIQTHWGWMVHAVHPSETDPHVDRKLEARERIREQRFVRRKDREVREGIEVREQQRRLRMMRDRARLVQIEDEEDEL